MPRTAGPEPGCTTGKDFELCKLSCCKKCTFCARALAKERVKSRVVRVSDTKKLQIKICEQCFLCHSIVCCPTCSKCPQCCTKSTCRGQTSKFLENLARSRGRSEGSSNPERGLLPSLPDPPPTHTIPYSHKPVCQSPQEQLPVGGITSAYRQKSGRKGSKSKITRILQPAILSPKTQRQMEASTGPKQFKRFPKSGKVQDGDTGNHQNIPPARRVGHLSRLQRCLLSHTDTGTIQKISTFSCPGPDLPVQSIAFRSVHSAHGVHCISQRGETDGHTQGYKNPPVLDDWLVRARSQHLCLQHTRLLVQMCQNLGWLVNLEKSELEPKQVFDFVGYQFDLRSGRVRPTPDRWQSLQDKIQPLLSLPTCPVRQFMSLIGLLTATEKQVHLGRLHMRPIQWHLKNNWRVPESLEKVIPLPRSLHPHLQWWLEEDKVLQGQPLHPVRHALQIFTDASKEGWGAHLNEFTTRGSWSIPESKLHINLLELKAVFLALKEFQDLCVGKIVLVATDNTTVVAYINKEGGMRSGPLCALLWRILTWCSQRQVTLKARHIPGHLNVIADKLSRLGQTIQTEWSLLPEVFQQICIQWHRPQIDLFATRFNHKLPQFVSPVPDSGPGCIRLSTDGHIGQSGGEASGLPMQETRSDCPGVAQHALVLGLGGHVQPGPSQPAHPAQSANTTIQSDPSQKSDQPKSPCLAPRATKIKEQGFSEAVAARIEAPQRRSTRSVYEAKWTIFKKWCVSNQVDFGSPPIKSVADFLMYLFEDKKLQPSTIDGYRSAIADKLGDTTVNISKDDNLTRLLESFHRDRPKGRRGIPSWNLSLVLHQLTKAPFEPLKEASLKHLTFKTVFLLALGSGKRRSEIHAWQHKNIRHQSDWSKVSLFPSRSFLSKNQLAKEGPGSVAPVVIPALAPTLDRSLKSDRSLCPVRALRYYLDRTSDIRQDKQLVFVFKKGFDKDISPATISSWIKQTVILCYELSDHQAHTLHQVKAHDVRAFAASKAFQSGVSLEQILSACHWKSHNTFTQFYLKDVAWADSELYHLGPVVAAQQIHQRTDT